MIQISLVYKRTCCIYDELEVALNLIPCNRKDTIIGDLNVKIWKESLIKGGILVYEMKQITMDINLINYVFEIGLVIKSIMFLH